MCNLQRCTEHMFALWRSRLVQSGVSDHEAMDTLINALQMIPQLKHVANKCMDMLGKFPHAIPGIITCGWWFLSIDICKCARRALGICSS